MKKLFLMLLAVAMLVTLVACGDEHEFASSWKSDATDHWHACTEEGCTEVQGKAAHTFVTKGVTKAAVGTTAGEETYECSVCGFEKTEPFAAMAEDGWKALFTLENVKISGKMGEEPAEFLINGAVVQMTAAGHTDYVTREMAVAYVDFSTRYADFSTTDGKTYKAATSEIAQGKVVNVEITIADGKLVSVIYSPEGDEQTATFTFSNWGTVTVAAPSLTAEQWANAVSSTTLNNYSVDMVTKPTNGEWIFEWYQFNGSAYSHERGVTTNQQLGEVTGTEGTLENAGLNLLPGMAALMQLDVTKFAVDGAAGAQYGWSDRIVYSYTESVPGFADSKATTKLILCMTADDQIDKLIVVLSDGTTVSYEFVDYGETTPDLSHSTSQEPGNL